MSAGLGARQRALLQAVAATTSTDSVDALPVLSYLAVPDIIPDPALDVGRFDFGELCAAAIYSLEGAPGYSQGRANRRALNGLADRELVNIHIYPQTFHAAEAKNGFVKVREWVNITPAGLAETRSADRQPGPGEVPAPRRPS